MKLHLHLVVSIIVLILFIGIGAYAYERVEGWNRLDSVYFVVVTMTTIGYGDLVPQTEIGKVFTMFFSFLGIAMAFYFISIVGGFLFKKHLTSRINQIENKIQKKEELEKKEKLKKK